jgi:hypothetical protein
MTTDSPLHLYSLIGHKSLDCISMEVFLNPQFDMFHMVHIAQSCVGIKYNHVIHSFVFHVMRQSHTRDSHKQVQVYNLETNKNSRSSS